MSGNLQVRTITTGAVIAFRADLVKLSSDEPLPPGSRVRLELLDEGDQLRLILSGKIVGIERSQEGEHFTLSVRLHSLPRKDRAVLEALVAAAIDGGTAT